MHVRARLSLPPHLTGWNSRCIKGLGTIGFIFSKRQKHGRDRPCQEGRGASCQRETFEPRGEVVLESLRTNLSNVVEDSRFQGYYEEPGIHKKKPEAG